MADIGVVVLVGGAILACGSLLAVSFEPRGAPDSKVETIQGLHSGDVARVQGVIIGPAGSVVLYANEGFCGTAISAHPAADCWYWTVEPFTIYANGSSLKVLTANLDGNILGAPHTVRVNDSPGEPPGSGARMEYLAGDTVAVGGSVSGSPGAYSMDAEVIAPNLSDIPQVSGTVVEVTIGALLVSIPIMIAGGALAAVGFRRRAPRGAPGG